MKHVLLKTIVIVVGKLTRNRVLWGGVGFCRTPRGKKNFPIMQGGARQGGNWVRQNHVGQGRRSHPSDLPYPIPIPSWWHLNKMINKYLNCFLLLTIHQFYDLYIYIYIYRERERERVKFVIFLITQFLKLKKNCIKPPIWVHYLSGALGHSLSGLRLGLALK